MIIRLKEKCQLASLVTLEEKLVMEEICSKLKKGYQGNKIAFENQHYENNPNLYSIIFPEHLKNENIRKLCMRIANKMKIEVEVIPNEGYYASVHLKGNKKIIGYIYKELNVEQLVFQQFAFKNAM